MEITDLPCAIFCERRVLQLEPLGRITCPTSMPSSHRSLLPRQRYLPRRILCRCTFRRRIQHGRILKKPKVRHRDCRAVMPAISGEHVIDIPEFH